MVRPRKRPSNLDCHRQMIKCSYHCNRQPTDHSDNCYEGSYEFHESDLTALFTNDL